MLDRLSERWYIARMPIHPAYNRGGWYIRTADGYRVTEINNRAAIRQIVRDHNQVLATEGTGRVATRT